MKLQDKVVFITGGSDGMGKAMVKAAAAEGAKVAFVGRNADKCEKVLSEVREMGLDARYYIADVAVEEQLVAAIRQAADDLGAVDILVNNVGFDLQKPIHEVTSDEWKRCVDINLTAVYVASREVLPSMMERHAGNIINITSDAGLRPSKDTPAYCAAKAGVVMLTKDMALAYGPNGIRVNSIAPGLTETAMLSQVSAEYKEGLRSVIPMQRIGQPEDIAKAFVFLASEDADYVTGQVISVDGGLLWF